MNHPSEFSFFGSNYYNLRTCIKDILVYLQTLQPNKPMRFNIAEGGRDTSPSQVLSIFTSDRHAEAINNNYLTLYPVGTTQSIYADLRAAIRSALTGDYVTYDMLCTAMTPRRSFVYILRHKQSGNFILFTTRDFAENHLYEVCVALALIQQNVNAQIIQQLTAVLTKAGGQWDMPPEIVNAITDYTTTYTMYKKTHEYYEELKKGIIKPEDNMPAIEALQTKIDDMVAELNKKRTYLIDLQRRQFSIEMFGAREDEDFKAYYMSRLADILYVKRDSEYTHLELRAVMSFSEDVSDYLSAAVSKPSHPLNGYDMTIDIVQAVADRKLQVPIVSRMCIRQSVDGTVAAIMGQDIRNTHGSYRALVNRHITHYNCFSHAKELAMQYASRKDYIGFFEQLFYATSSINLYDSTVMREFIPTLINIRNDVPVRYRTDDGWVNTTIGGFHEILENQRAAIREAAERHARNASQGQEGSDNNTEQPALDTTEADTETTTEDDLPF